MSGRAGVECRVLLVGQEGLGSGSDGVATGGAEASRRRRPAGDSPARGFASSR
ncbi:hypothetical protein [Streptosporangium vulgare]|uniref:Uncharacterized protein n=1 Tax=Streptosporangium vulgare TaxID=46190 RepID=A0ABV5TNS5_9ACTN